VISPAAPVRVRPLVRLVTVLLIPAILAFGCFVAFLPALTNGFVNWDDGTNLVRNPHYRGLGWTQLSWMLTSPLLGHYMPVTWITFGLDYLLWGMMPFGYHLTNLLLHVANAVVFYALALRLLRAGLAGTRGDSTWGLPLGAAAAALLFALHPLRVESVAWVTERKDVLSGLFYLLTVLTYLRYRDSIARKEARRRYWACLTLFVLALLSKSMSVTAPVVFLLLDLYPLRRLGGKRWSWANVLPLLRDKVPFVVLSLVAGVATVFAASNIGAMTPSASLSVAERLSISAYSLTFYLWKTVVPVNLSPMYAMPQPLDPGAWPFVLSGVVVAILALVAVAARRQTPALAAAGTAYVVILLPVVGLLHNGPQIAADRYTYLACGGWAVLVGAGLARWWMAPRSSALRILAGSLVVSTCAALGTLTWNQTKIWYNTTTLWTHAIAAAPSAKAHLELGLTLKDQGKMAEAAAQFRESVRLFPGHATAHAALGFAADALGNPLEAAEHFQRALAHTRESDAHPATVVRGLAHRGLGQMLQRQGKLAEAAEHFHHVLRDHPTDAETLFSLAVVLAQQGKLAEASARFWEVLRVDPGYASAHSALGLAAVIQGRLTDAVEHFQQALAINPDDVEANSGLGQVLERHGKLAEATEHFRRALRANPADAEARSHLIRVLERQGRIAEAAEHGRRSPRL
jgi:tetratricopeptide (TPR) repeat protein